MGTKGLDWWEKRREDLSALSEEKFAAKYKVGATTVRRWRRKLGIKIGSNTTEPLCDWKRIDWEMRSTSDIARELGCNRTTVQKWRKRVGKPYRLHDEPWLLWPKAAKREIGWVLAKNDAPGKSWRFIPLRKMVGRLRDDWKCDTATKATVTAYCKKVLGRRDWKTP